MIDKEGIRTSPEKIGQLRDDAKLKMGGGRKNGKTGLSGPVSLGTFGF
ncbi:MAG TPA: hypothetical protein VGD27_08570 [Longimicrobiales bacterium]